MFMEQLTSPLAVRRIAGEPRSLVIHARDGWLKSIRADKLEFFNKLVKHATSKGMATRIVAADSGASNLFLNEDHINLMVDRPATYGCNILHAAPSYIWGFWYLDELGTFANSSLRFAQFCPDRVDGGHAEWFFNGVSSYMLRENVGKLPQEARMNVPMQDAAAAIFCQEIEGDPHRSHYLTTEQMIRVTAMTCANERIYVKPHPNQSKPARRAIMEIAADYPRICITDASTHDLIAASRMVVTQNSAAGFEALMQKRCVITCAKSDYWHATLTPKTETDLAEALRFGPDAMADFEYEKFFYWFLDRNCLEPAKHEFARRAWARIADKAFL